MLIRRLGLMAWLIALISGLLQLATGQPAVADESAVRPGRLFVEPATPHALGFRWPLAGDSNGDAEAALHYRLLGSEVWQAGPALFRVGRESRQPERRRREGVLLAGSLVGLAAGRRYEVRLALVDPDGGGVQRTLRLRTADEPRLPSGLRRRHVRPEPRDSLGPGTGSAADPFRGLEAALSAARPGDLLLLAPGRYRVAGLVPARSGEPGRPIVVQGEGGGVLLDGGGGERLLDLSDRRHVWIRGLTLRNADTLIRADRAHGLLVQGNHFEVSRAGYVSAGAVAEESQGQFVLDNHFVGSTHWPRSKGIEHIFGVGLSGSGHVIAYNRMESLGDCIRGAWLEGGRGLLSASDIHHNDLQSCTDDAIEVDHADANVRVFANRITNSFAGISLQPIFGGPVYLYRNRIYNTLYSPFKLHNDTAGVLMIHNTSIRAGIPFFIRTSTETVRDSLTRNNLFVGTSGPALASTAGMIGSDFDSDGYAWSDGDFALWNKRRYPTVESALAGGALYGRYGALRLDARTLFDSDLAPVSDASRRYDSEVNRPLLSARSPARDRGVPLAGFNDDFLGQAPDLGCCEQGLALPAVGPRAAFVP